MVKWFRYIVRAYKEDGTLAKVVEEKGWKDKSEPHESDRTRSKMPHIGIECFPAGHHKENRSEYLKSE